MIEDEEEKYPLILEDKGTDNFENVSKEKEKSQQDLVDEFQNAQRNQLPGVLLKFMYQVDLSIFCLLRKFKHGKKYPSMSLIFEESGIDKFNSIIISHEGKSINVQLETEDNYYSDKITYSHLFSKRKGKFSMNEYFDSFSKQIFCKSLNSFHNAAYYIVYTDSNLDLTDTKSLNGGRYKEFYPFKFITFDMKTSGLLRKFLLISDKQEQSFYQFAKDAKTKEELLKRLEFSLVMQEIINERKITPDYQREMKEAFLDNLIFAVNQPGRAEFNSIVKSEIEKDEETSINYSLLQEKMIDTLREQPKHKKQDNAVSECLYELNLLQAFLHSMFLNYRINYINFEGRSKYTPSELTIDYQGNKTCIIVHNTNSIISHSKLFPLTKTWKIYKFSINRLFSFFTERLDSDIKYFVIYTNQRLGITKDLILNKRKSMHDTSLKFDEILIHKTKYEVFRNLWCIDENNLYRFTRETETKEKLLSLLELPDSLQEEKEEGTFTSYDEQQLKMKFLKKLIFAVDQRNMTRLSNVIWDKVEKSNNSLNIPYNYLELHEVTLRWIESHDFGPATKPIMKNLLLDIKNNRFRHQKIYVESIIEEIKICRCAVNHEGSHSFNQLLNFLVVGKGKKYIEVLRKNDINLQSVSSIIRRSESNSIKAVENVYNLLFDENGIESNYLKILKKEKVAISNVSNILGGARIYFTKAFKDLFHLWFDEEGRKTLYLTTLDKNKIKLSSMCTILQGSGIYAAKAYKDLFSIWFDDEGNKKQYLETLKREKVMFRNLANILNFTGVNSVKIYKELHDLLFDEHGKKQHLKVLEKEGVKLASIFSILRGSRENVVQTFEKFYNCWFDENGNKTQILKDLEEIGVNTSILSNILFNSGVHAVPAFKDVCAAFIDQQGSITQKLQHFLESKDGKSFTLRNVSGLLRYSRLKTKEVIDGLHDVCFDSNGKRKQLLDDFYKIGFTPNDISRALHSTRTRNSSLLVKLHEILFDVEGEKSKLFNDFCSIGFDQASICHLVCGSVENVENFHYFCFVGDTKIYLEHFERENFNLKSIIKALQRSGSYICTAFKVLHDIFFDNAGNKSQLYTDFCKAGFTSNNLLLILRRCGRNAAIYLKRFHQACFGRENYLDHFLAEKEFFSPDSLCLILSGMVSASSTIEKLHDLCFNEVGNRTCYFDDIIRQSYTVDQVIRLLYDKMREPHHISEFNSQESLDLSLENRSGKRKSDGEDFIQQKYMKKES